ncbi:hypothetical protein AAZX31_06G185600 [Glycine max]
MSWRRVAMSIQALLTHALLFSFTFLAFKLDLLLHTHGRKRSNNGWSVESTLSHTFWLRFLHILQRITASLFFS